MRLIFLDFESYYANDYTLRDMTPPEYILSTQWETICCGVQEGAGSPYLVDGPDFAAWLRDIEPSSAITVTHNAMFDAAILAWRYGFVPSTTLCTKLLTSATIGGFVKDNKLKTVAAALGLGVKDEGALVNAKGLHRQDIIDSGQWPRYTQYCLDDTRMCAGIFAKLIHMLPVRERKVMDMVMRCTIEPKMMLDVPRLEQAVKRIKEEKEELLAAAGTSVVDLMSAAKFTAALEGLGVTVEMKTSPKGKQIPAIARTDKFMEELSEHDDPRVQAMAAARLGHKSTIEETRCRRLISIGKLPWPGSSASIPVPLVYAGTHTHRLSGTWSLNLQNLPKGSELRNSLCAPPGHKLLVADLSQIEARILATLAREDALHRAFAEGEDVYATFANTVFGYPIERGSAERFIGKTAILGLGYQCGAMKFHNMVLKSSRQFGIELKVPFDEKIARKIVDTYRLKHQKIMRLWSDLDRAIESTLVQAGKAIEQWIGPVGFVPGRVTLPGGLCLRYPQLLKNEEGDYQYTYGREVRKLYGGALCENIVQALARNVAMDAAYRLADAGLRFALQVHDELVFVVPDGHEAWATDEIKLEMTRPPSWMPNLPLAVEVSKPAQRYGEAK